MKKILYAIGAVVLLFIVEQLLQWPYLLKTAIKIPLFGLVPYMMIRPLKLRMSKGDVLWMTGVSVFVFSIILFAYWIFNIFIDPQSIQEDIQGRMMISDQMFYAAALYTVVINAFLEEVFFRGLIYQSKMTPYRGYLSAALFAIYHVAIFKTWFSMPITALILLGLFTGGLIFNAFVKRTGSLLASYLIHMSADLAIVVIGYLILM